MTSVISKSSQKNGDISPCLKKGDISPSPFGLLENQILKLILGDLLSLLRVAVANHSNFMAIDQFASIPTRNAQKRRDND